MIIPERVGDVIDTALREYQDKCEKHEYWDFARTELETTKDALFWLSQQQMGATGSSVQLTIEDADELIRLGRMVADAFLEVQEEISAEAESAAWILNVRLDDLEAIVEKVKNGVSNG